MLGGEQQQENSGRGNELKEDLKTEAKASSLLLLLNSLSSHYIDSTPTMLPNLKLLNELLRVLKEIKM